MNKLIRPAKQALARKYGYQNVSVKNGTGTAWGWVHVSIKTAKPIVECRGDEAYMLCSIHREAERTILSEAREIMHKAWQSEGLKPYSYTVDDGYGSESEEVRIDVNYL